MPGDLSPFTSDPELIDTLLSPETRTVMVVGGSDTGKTTLVELVLALTAAKAETAVVDADTGQSHVGPPTTIGWGSLEDDFRGWEAIALRGYYFTGALSPVRNLLPCTAGLKIMTDEAREACGKVIIDTSGLVSEPFGRALKQHAIDLIRPQLILALERSGELDLVLSPYRTGRAGIRVARIPVPDEMGAKSTADRTEYRRRLFERFFADSRKARLELDKLGVRFTRDRVPLDSSHLAGRIVSFRDEHNRDFALGIATGVSDGLLQVDLRAIEEKKNPAVVVVGSYSIDR
jgi:polynucleotide 5'-hydroxyl-kinase GRC3/NOL9